MPRGAISLFCGGLVLQVLMSGNGLKSRHSGFSDKWTARSELTATMWDFVRKARKTNIAFQGGRTARQEKRNEKQVWQLGARFGRQGI